MLTKAIEVDVAHIYPHSMLSSEGVYTGRVGLTFWDQLRMFWSDDRVYAWWKAIFENPYNSGVGVDACYNLICLNPHVHRCWNKGYFAFKPIELSDDRKRLNLQFVWLP